MCVSCKAGCYFYIVKVKYSSTSNRESLADEEVVYLLYVVSIYATLLIIGIFFLTKLNIYFFK